MEPREGAFSGFGLTEAEVFEDPFVKPSPVKRTHEEPVDVEATPAGGKKILKTQATAIAERLEEQGIIDRGEVLGVLSVAVGRTLGKISELLYDEAHELLLGDASAWEGRVEDYALATFVDDPPAE